MDSIDNKLTIVENAIDASGLTKTAIADRLNITRQYLGQLLKDEDKLTFDWIAKIGKVIHYDFANDFPDIKMYSAYQVSEPGAVYETPLNKCIQERDSWKDTAYKLSQDLIELQKKYSSMLEKAVEQGVKLA